MGVNVLPYPLTQPNNIATSQSPLTARHLSGLTHPFRHLLPRPALTWRWPSDDTGLRDAEGGTG